MSPPGFEVGTVQQVMNRYNNYDIPGHSLNLRGECEWNF